MLVAVKVTATPPPPASGGRITFGYAPTIGGNNFVVAA
jgi:hypothetical protein